MASNKYLARLPKSGTQYTTQKSRKKNVEQLFTYSCVKAMAIYTYLYYIKKSVTGKLSINVCQNLFYLYNKRHLYW